MPHDMLTHLAQRPVMQYWHNARTQLLTHQPPSPTALTRNACCTGRKPHDEWRRLGGETLHQSEHTAIVQVTLPYWRSTSTLQNTKQTRDTILKVAAGLNNDNAVLHFRSEYYDNGEKDLYYQNAPGWTNLSGGRRPRLLASVTDVCVWITGATKCAPLITDVKYFIMEKDVHTEVTLEQVKELAIPVKPIPVLQQPQQQAKTADAISSAAPAAQPSTNTNSQSATVNAVETEAVQVKANLQPTFYHNPLTPFPNSLRQTARASSRCSAPSWLRPRPSRISPTSRTAPHPNSYPNSIPHRNHNHHPHLHPSPNSNPNPKPHRNPNPHLHYTYTHTHTLTLTLTQALTLTLTLSLTLSLIHI